MNSRGYKQIQNLLEETNDAFVSYAGSLNSDYAAFASMRLAEFKTLLGKPDLTDSELRQLLRRGENSRRRKDPEGNWGTFIAHYVAKHANDAGTAAAH